MFYSLKTNPSTGHQKHRINNYKKSFNNNNNKNNKLIETIKKKRRNLNKKKTIYGNVYIGHNRYSTKHKVGGSLFVNRTYMPKYNPCKTKKNKNRALVLLFITEDRIHPTVKIPLSYL